MSQIKGKQDAPSLYIKSKLGRQHPRAPLAAAINPSAPLHAFASSCDWSIQVSASVLFGRRNC